MGAPRGKSLELSRRERQIMDVVWQRGQATVAEVLEGISDPPSYSAIRALLAILEKKGHLSHAEEGPRYVYRPTAPRQEARNSALRRLVETFFNNSVDQAVMALLDLKSARNPETLKRLSKMIEEGKKP